MLQAVEHIAVYACASVFFDAKGEERLHPVTCRLCVLHFTVHRAVEVQTDKRITCGLFQRADRSLIPLAALRWPHSLAN